MARVSPIDNCAERAAAGDHQPTIRTRPAYACWREAWAQARAMTPAATNIISGRLSYDVFAGDRYLYSGEFSLRGRLIITTLAVVVLSAGVVGAWALVGRAIGHVGKSGRR